MTEQQQGRPNRAQETQCDQDPACGFAEGGGDDEKAAGTEAQLLEVPGGAGDSVAAEPAEQLLAAVRHHEHAEDQAREQEARAQGRQGQRCRSWWT